MRAGSSALRTSTSWPRIASGGWAISRSSPEMQGRGIGSALLRSALADLSRRGMRIAELNVDSQNESGAVHLYRKVGMTVFREWLDYRAVHRGNADAGVTRPRRPHRRR